MHNKEISRTFSNKQKDKDLSWLKTLVFIYLFSFGVIIIINIIRPFFGEEYYKIPLEIFNLLPTSLFIFIFILRSINQKNVALLQKEEKLKVSNNSKYKNSGLTKNEADGLESLLRLFMEEKKVFLNSELTIDELSNVMGVNKHHLSQVINSTTGSNFFHFVNKYRVLEFQQVLKENRYPNYSLTGTALECGFNSSSSFYSIFKKYTGMTPKQYISSNKTSINELS